MKLTTRKAHMRKGRLVKKHMMKVKKSSSMISGRMNGNFERKTDDLERSRQYVDMKDRYLLFDKIKNLPGYKKSTMVKKSGVFDFLDGNKEDTKIPVSKVIPEIFDEQYSKYDYDNAVRATKQKGHKLGYTNVDVDKVLDDRNKKIKG